MNMNFTKTLFGHVKHIIRGINRFDKIFAIESYCKEAGKLFFDNQHKKLPICKKCSKLFQDELTNLAFGC